MAETKKRQRFFEVELPILKKETQLYAHDLRELEGRTIIYDLTRLLRGKSVLLKMNVKVDGEKATASPKEFILLPYFIRRMIRKGTSWIEDSFSANTKDAVVIVKPFLITRKKVSRAIRKALREKAREELIDYLKEKDTESVFNDLLQNKVQKPLSLKLKKIYPLSLCEIRIFSIRKKLN